MAVALLVVFGVLALVLILGSAKVSKMAEREIKKTPSAANLPQWNVSVTTSSEEKITVRKAAVFLADGKTRIPGCSQLSDGRFHLKRATADRDGGLTHEEFTYSDKRSAVKKSRELFPVEWHKIDAPPPEVVRQARDDLTALEKELGGE